MAKPLCQHFGPCGGCDWQDLSYADQLARKRDRLVELLRASLGSRAPEVQPVVGMDVDQTGWPWRFRQKASFVFGNSADGRLTIGHYAARSPRVVPIVECPVHSDRANRIAFALHEHLARAGISAAGPDLRGVVRHLLIRTTRDDREAVAMLVVTRNEKALRAPIRRFLAGAERPTGFFLNIHAKPGPYLIGRETLRIDGRSYVRERVSETAFLVSPTAFFQTNAAIAGTLVDLVLRHAPDTPILDVADLYAGSGLFTLPLARRGHRVTAIEENERAVADGEANARLNNVTERVRFIRARVEDALSRLVRAPRAGAHALAEGRPDLVVMDPPRAGCPAPVISRLFGEIAPATVVYVSCNPKALATELPALMEHGYDVRRVQPVDMFPHTTHIETVATIVRTRD